MIYGNLLPFAAVQSVTLTRGISYPAVFSDTCPPSTGMYGITAMGVERNCSSIFVAYLTSGILIHSP
jgi:hypothetical protein